MTTIAKEKFLPKNPEKALSNLKDKLYERLEFCRSIAALEYPEWFNMHDYASGHWSARHKAAESEGKRLEETLDLIERS